jgi:type II secretory pathway component PulM
LSTNLFTTGSGPASTLTTIGFFFVLFIGVTLWVALFHPDRDRREHARKILSELLDVVRSGRGRRR